MASPNYVINPVSEYLCDFAHCPEGENHGRYIIANSRCDGQVKRLQVRCEKEVNPSFSHLHLFVPVYGPGSPLSLYITYSWSHLFHKEKAGGMRQEQPGSDSQ